MDLEKIYREETGCEACEGRLEGLTTVQYTEHYVEWLEEKVSKLPIHGVSVREFECDDVVCTNDGRMWVITEIDGDDVYVTGNGKRDYPLEKSDITHAH